MKEFLQGSKDNKLQGHILIRNYISNKAFDTEYVARDKEI